jgi:arylsulfatase A-like enzyme
VKFLPAFLLLVLGGFAGAAEARKPNILWLIAEDMGPALGCYGREQVWTPNLDRLAAEGVRYTHAYTTAPVCSASRSAFLTGMYQTTIGAQNHRSHRDDNYHVPAGVRVLPDWLRELGYFNANLVTLPPACEFKGTGKTDWNFTYDGKPFESSDWGDLKAHQPFCAQLNFQETHRNYRAPAKADPAKVRIPPYYPDHPVTRADMAKYLDAASELDRKIGLVLEQLRADGLEENTVVVFIADHGESHVRGKQFCYEEGLHIPMIIRWPRAAPAPAQVKPGLVDERFIEGIDLVPTFIAIAGGHKPSAMQGRVFLGEQAEAFPREYAFGARDRCDETVFRLRTVRDGRYRYIRNFTPERPFLQANAYKERQYPVWNLLKQLHAEGKLTPAQEFLCQPTMPAEELYDMEADPDEVANLAGSPKAEHVAARERLRAVLERWIAETHDQGRVLEPEEVVKRKGAIGAAKE